MSRWIGAFFVVAIATAAVAFFHLKGVLQSEDKPAGVLESYLKNLGIERPERKTAAPEFALEDPAGKQVSLKELRGKVVFLNFWATWCPPCVREMPTMEKLHQEMGKDGLVILAINFRETPEQVKEFFAKHSLTFTALLDRDGKVSELYQAWGLPMSVIVNKRGELVGKLSGYRDWNSTEARQLFQELLAEES